MSESFMRPSTGPVIVYTCGTFDLLHYGHLNMLINAKGLGDKLVVAVSTDELVAQYKGRPPVVPFAERVRLVSELRCVDVCIPQHDRDKFAAWERIRFDVWVVGDDWFGRQDYMDYRQKFDAVNVKSVFLPYTKDLSSTLRRTAVEQEASHGK